MSAIYAKTRKINRVVTGAPDTYYQLGGSILDSNYEPRPQIGEEVAGDVGRTLASMKLVGTKPQLQWKMNVRRLDDYITPYAIITNNGTVPAHTLYVSDGTEHFKLTDVKVNTCKLSISQTESIRAEITVLAKAYANLASVGTFLFRTDAAMYKDAVQTLTIGGVAIAKWKEIEISCDNNVLQETLGTTTAPAEVEEQEAKHEISITRARSGSSLIGDAYSGTEKDIVITLRDNQGTPVTKTLTYAAALIQTARIEDRDLGIIYERLTCKAKNVVIS